MESVGDKEDGEQSKDREDPRKQQADAQHVMFNFSTPKPPNVADRAGAGGVNGGGSGSSQRQSVMINFFTPTSPNVAGAAGRDGGDGGGSDSPQCQSVMINFFTPTTPNVAGRAGAGGVDSGAPRSVRVQQSRRIEEPSPAHNLCVYA